MTNYLSLWLLCILSGFAWLWIHVNDSYVHAVEICDNAKDDDGDGLIDLNDPDCKCAEAKPVSLIPNPSFEEMNCCPTNRSQLDCAKDWIQASEATTDYLNTCGWMGWDYLPPPLPFPDGRGCVGFRNGRFRNNAQPNWKEYAGACLISPLRKGITYRFRFNIGFTNPINSPPTEVVFFGSTDCIYLPFGVGDPGYGCPTNGPGWKRLGSVFASGSNSWTTQNITITPTEDIYAIAIGPNCTPEAANDDLYYFFDNLVLADQHAFDFEILAEGHPCSDLFTLKVPAYDTIQYQWYRNGIALIGETKPELQVKTGDGDYVVRVLSPTDCKVTRPYLHRRPVAFGRINEVICKGESYSLSNKSVTKSGVYYDTLKTAFNCDSILELHLRVADEQYDTVRAKIFEGESYSVGRIHYNRPGAYNAVLQSVYGCDSLVHLDLDFYHVYFPTAFSPNGDGNNDVFTIFGNTDLLEVNNLQIFNRWGNLVFEQHHFLPNETAAGWNGLYKGQAAATGVYVYTSQLRMEDGAVRSFSGSFVLVR